MSLEWLARIGLILWLVYSVAAAAEGLKPRGSYSYRLIGALTEITLVSTLTWASWWA